MSALNEILDPNNWDVSAQWQDGSPLGYDEVTYVGDPVYVEAAAELVSLNTRLARALELLRAVNKTGGVVVEYYQKRPLRDWITEYLNEVDGKETATK